ncbi:MAG: hypothetical protein KGN76_04080 [Acidobacteriota bacterium]|nr:hypothetical protein [Acidobacteriota bacterium]
MSATLRTPRLLAALALAALTTTACHRQSVTPPVATPSLTIDRTSAALGSPIELHYHFTVAKDAKFDQNYWVMVHFVNADEELMWTDDHQPPVPTTQWKPGQEIDYTRTLFLPVYPYVGQATVQVGLYSPTTKQRLTLSGTDIGQKAYQVARLEILPQTASVPLDYQSGWNDLETAQGTPANQWRWTKKNAVITFPNPKRDITFYLDLDTGAVFDSQQVTVTAAGQPVTQLTLAANQRELKLIPISAAQLGTGDTATIGLDVDKTFVPAQIPALHNADPRELGVRVFHAFVLPR